MVAWQITTCLEIVCTVPRKDFTPHYVWRSRVIDPSNWDLFLPIANDNESHSMTKYSLYLVCGFTLWTNWSNSRLEKGSVAYIARWNTLDTYSVSIIHFVLYFWAYPSLGSVRSWTQLVEAVSIVLWPEATRLAIHSTCASAPVHGHGSQVETWKFTKLSLWLNIEPRRQLLLEFLRGWRGRGINTTWGGTEKGGRNVCRQIETDDLWTSFI